MTSEQWRAFLSMLGFEEDPPECWLVYTIRLGILAGMELGFGYRVVCMWE
jgi:hypothetical protein